MLLGVIIGFILFSFLLDQYLNYLNSKSWTTELPKELSDLYDEEKYAKAQAYEKEKKWIGNIAGIISTVVILIVLLFGGFALLHDFVASKTSNLILQGYLFFGIMGVASEIMSLPFSLYNTFKIESKYGFNKMTWKTYVGDKIKGTIMSMIIGGALYAAFVYFYQAMGGNFWIYAWILFTAFTLFFTMFYTSLIVPIFNKLVPLQEGSLREQIENFANKVGFPLTNIFVIDGSKRSTKANAYFSGIGAKKSIVLFDTLMDEHEEEEIVGILAHEIGHYKKKHITQSFVLSTINMGIMLFLLAAFIDSPALSQALGANNAVFHLNLMAFGLLYSPISLITGLLFNVLSRKNEYEADNYAKENFGSGPLITALKKLSVNHLSNLNPHPAYVFFHYSHPPLLERIKNLKR